MAPPRLSIVIAAHNAAAPLERCLRALSPQAAQAGAEIIVAESSTDGTADVLGRFPEVRHVRCAGSLTVPRLRAEGIALASGAVIAILDPFSIVDDNWVEALLDEHDRRPNLAIGGAVEPHNPDRQGFWAWVTYINEYGLFMLPVRSGETDILPGSNVSYKRAALFDEHERPRHPVFWKTFVNWELRAAGSPLWLSPSIVVRLYKPVAFLDFLRTRYHHGRCFAAMRGGEWGAGGRWMRAVASPLLPPLLLWRWGSAYLRKRRYRSRLIWSAPLQLLLFSSWAWGECAGYCCGGGRSCRQLYY